MSALMVAVEVIDSINRLLEIDQNDSEDDTYAQLSYDEIAEYRKCIDITVKWQARVKRYRQY